MHYIDCSRTGNWTWTVKIYPYNNLCMMMSSPSVSCVNGGGILLAVICSVIWQ